MLWLYALIIFVIYVVIAGIVITVRNHLRIRRIRRTSASQPRPICPMCGSSRLRTETTGLWDGVQTSAGQRPHGSFWYGVCDECDCLCGKCDDAEGDGPIEEVHDDDVFGTWAMDPLALDRLSHSANRKEETPKTIREAVWLLMRSLPQQTKDFIRGTPTIDDLHLFHFDIGLTIRNTFGLWKEDNPLLAECRVAPDNGAGADVASFVILTAFRQRLLELASSDAMIRARQRWQDHEREKALKMEFKAAKDAAITDRRCKFCGQPCPRYRKTCKYCRQEVGRENV